MLTVKNLSVYYIKNDVPIYILRNIDFRLALGEISGLVGESGSGKSIFVKAILRLLPENLHCSVDSIQFNETELTTLSGSEFRSLLGNQISIIFQDPMTALNPLLKIGNQLEESIKIHSSSSKKRRLEKINYLLKKVGIQRPQSVLSMYPHQLSGGMKQRILIAQALLNDPHLLIADEPTTAIDATTQAQILKLILNLQSEFNLSVLFISHDLNVVYRLTTETWILYAGHLMEMGLSGEIFKNPLHPYTRGLIQANPSVGKKNTPIPIPGHIPSPEEHPEGCVFEPRCPIAKNKCKQLRPPETNYGSRKVFCFFTQKDLT